METIRRTYYFRLVTLLAVNLQFLTGFSQDSTPSYEYNLVENKSELAPGENADEKIRKNFFLLTEVNKRECYVGEALMAVFKAYSRLDANSQVVKRPSLTGFSVMEMVDAYSNQPHVEKYNGEYYFVHLIRKVQLFPLQEGEFILEPAQVESTVYFTRPGNRSSRRLRNLFRRSGPHEDTSLVRRVLLETPPVTIRVNALPEENRPEDFSGAVGSFELDLKVSESSVAQDVPMKVMLLISGSGNIPLITDPWISWPEGVKVSGPMVTEKVNRYVYPLAGTKIFEYVIQSRDTGRLNIPPVHFSYFDARSGTYKTAESRMVGFTVTPRRKTGNGSLSSDLFQRDSGVIYFYYAGIILLLVAGTVVLIVKRKKR